MDINLSIELVPTANVFASALKADAQKVAGEIVREITEFAPDEMRDLMSLKSPSDKGTPPGIRTRNLYNSFQGSMTDSDTGQIQMAYYAEFLDPFFGGNLDRPFVLEGVDRAIVKTVKNL